MSEYKWLNAAIVPFSKTTEVMTRPSVTNDWFGSFWLFCAVIVHHFPLLVLLHAHLHSLDLLLTFPPVTWFEHALLMKMKMIKSNSVPWFSSYLNSIMFINTSRLLEHRIKWIFFFIIWSPRRLVFMSMFSWFRIHFHFKQHSNDGTTNTSNFGYSIINRNFKYPEIREKKAKTPKNYSFNNSRDYQTRLKEDLIKREDQKLVFIRIKIKIIIICPIEEVSF